MTNSIPILYSFRRCPYAMRARLALTYAQIEREHREIVLRDKPAHMLEISPKGTVPVLLLPNGDVIDESLDIMKWALSEHDPEHWLPTNTQMQDEIFNLIQRNDTTFKRFLDHYKYPNRYPDEDITGQAARDAAIAILEDLNNRIQKNGYLISERISLADMAIFPFIRQFAHVDRDWFYAQKSLKNIQEWLTQHLESDIFKNIMKKHEIYANTAN